MHRTTFVVLALLVGFVAACATGEPDRSALANDDDTCGDRVCDPDETATSCPSDCGMVAQCGDGTCNGSETINTCSRDCDGGGGGGGGGNDGAVCGDGNCNGEETATSCAADCGGGGGGGSCVHDVCTSGDALSSDCDTCAGSVCAGDDYCCTVEWDSFCVDAVTTYCDPSTCGGGGGGGGGTCAHSECTDGVALDSTCSACADALCYWDSYCCTDEWDVFCVDEVVDYCDPGTCP
jgi:hypothetical protein